jgi:phospholipid/cholesterol/gamma-HCH transport system ATP-binding protein
MRSESTASGDSNSTILSSAEVSPEIEVRDLEMSYGSYVVMRDINFTVAKGQVLVIMGGSGCGKSTLLKYMIGLKEVTHGDVLYKGESFVKASQEEREKAQRTFGVLYQAGALWS